MLDPFLLPFMQRALIGGILVGAITGYFGGFVVQRRMAFLGSGLAHAAFGGVALGLLLGLPPMGTALPFTVAVALGVVWLRARTVLAEDTAIGVFFAVAMALGIIFLSVREGYAGDAYTYLFGSILAITWGDIGLTAAALAATAFTLPLWPRWAYATFDRTLARADRLKVSRDDALLAVGIALAVVVSVKVVGIVLLAAFLVLPAATARLLSQTFAGMTLRSVLIGVGTAIAGLYLSYYADLPSGPCIVLSQAALFFAALALGATRR